ncbi:TSC22 domain family protein 2-like [Sphaeramia orbicularis]|uniref:TSC22 domain family protein 2-like n=1 Tax=Sphaeramia orbicularis TaxID=375764 RepID=A0A672YGG2_9TELE|nr:TSC22 domain family protein 2-like [Sphaeramia orbicularis]XP_029988897.1 TSC22 domain family protein 2-like [Sphaeramia orbicularis]
MSKMPAKKKSCFQITSVTQAQVAASSITDDTESLEDPDESRTEDVSSEIFDVSRADQGVCERSSSEETLNTGVEQQEVQAAPTGPTNGGPASKSTGTGRTTPHSLGGNVPVPGPAFVPSPVPTLSSSVCPTAPVSSSCSSRFRVIKLDHGTGEPFRRGRWTCTDFYERDSDSSRTVDSIKPNVSHDPTVDGDSGLGTTCNSVVTSSAFSAQAVDNTVESGHLVTQPNPSEPLQQSYRLIPQIGSVTSAFQPTGYATTASQKPQANIKQPVAPQTFMSNSLNGVQQGAVQQKSPVVPPATQAQEYAYSTHTIGLSSGQHFGSSTQNFPVTSVSVGPPTSQGPSPLVTSAGPGGQGRGISAQVGDGALAPGLHLQVTNPPVLAPILPGSGQQQPASQTQPLGGLSVAPVPCVTTTHSSVQNVPATVPSTNNIPMGLPSLMPGTVGLVRPQGAHSGATTGHPSVSNQTEDRGQKSDLLPQSSAGVVPGKDSVKPFITERLTLPAPAVNTLFGIPISMDGDDDSSSGASVVAIDNKIEQAMDLVKSHLMYAVREEVEVLKEQIKELYERNSVLERENAVLKSLANSEQLGQLSNQLSQSSSTPSLLQQQQQQHPASTNNNSTSHAHYEGVQSVPHQPNITSA